MSAMSELDIACEDAYISAKMCMDNGEKFEDVSEAVFSHIFNHVGQDPDLRNWAVDRSSKICARVLKDQAEADMAKKSATDLYRILKDLTGVFIYCNGDGNPGNWEARLISQGYSEEVIGLFRKARRAIEIAERRDGSDI